MQALLDDFFYTHYNATIALGWYEIMFNVTGVAGKNFANSFYYCYLY